MLHSFERRRAARRLCRKKNLALHLIKLPEDMPPLGWAKLIPGLVMSTKPSRFTVTLSRVDGVRSGAALSTRNTVLVGVLRMCSGCAQAGCVLVGAQYNAVGRLRRTLPPAAQARAPSSSSPSSPQRPAPPACVA